MSDLIETYTVEEVAHALKVHPYTVRRLSREGKIPAFKFGSQWRYKKEDIDQWSKSYSFVKVKKRSKSKE